MNAKLSPKNESDRIRVLHEYEILNTAAEEEFDRITKIASLVCGTPISLISLVDKDMQWFKSRVGLEIDETTRDVSFCQYTLEEDQLMEVEDAKKDDRFKSNELVTLEPNIRYYAGLALIDPNGYALGALCVIDRVPRQLDQHQKEILTLLRDEVVALIVNRKEKEKYKESEQKLKAFFDNSQGLMCTHDLKGNFIAVNEAGAKTLGYTREEIQLRSLFDIVPSEGHKNLQDYLGAIVQRGTIKGEMRTLTRSGETRIWMFNNILQTNGNKIPYVIGNAVDITEQHFLEKELKHAQATLMRTGRVARIGSWEYTPADGKIVWSEITREIHEVPEDYETELTTALQFYKAGSSRNKIRTAIEHALATGEAWDLELEIVTFAGHELWIRALGNADFENGHCVRLYGTFQDIDKRKRIEAESSNSKKLLSEVLDATSAVAIIATDTTGVVTLFNTGAENLLGYRSEEVIGKLGLEHFHLKEELVLRAKELEVELGRSVDKLRFFVDMAELHGAEQREWTYCRKDGSRLYVSLAVTFIRDINENVIGYLAIATDISRIIHQREELEKAKLVAEQASAAKSQFLANMSHELRTPLNGIVGFTDLLLGTALEDTQREYLSIVDQSANLLLGIVNDILDFSKIEAGKLELDVEQTDLQDLVIQLTNFLNMQIKAKNLEFYLNIAADVPHYIWVDALRIKQVLMNLLSNATKFTEKGTIELSITVESHDATQAVLCFSVKDTGIGIKEDNVERIFDAFTQEDNSMTKRYGGTGLGLTISNKLLKMMGSELKLESTFGAGSRFFFTINVPAVWEINAWDELKKIKDVLIVAEEESERNDLDRMLSLKKINTVHAKTGFEVLQILKKGHHFDAILIDHQLPIISGIETIQNIREKNFDNNTEPTIIPIFSSNQQDIEQLCHSVAISRWLVKPFTPEELYTALVKVNVS
ncbi:MULTISPECIES: PAS domain S-box protein [Sphingobacterium]|jgi:PAS domain S-box-containing protein|uniref:Sensory/regulatory protein RpfC n=2 Tax=Sphingobacterium multivorum TaxID=28454 RepID=A0A653Y231_SPHMU|nr:MULTISPECIES: PAS domain S-box protein [Sphingobacterium]HBI86980.1 hybrid sensor histidine kinase/response regulator [Sphingobacterium sp.]QQT47045.1 PAS domain S-box protein [Sphingobacterium multivorum]QQT60437.1 PAS domain S-box protein [Sphingobacterium multivorum]SUJ88363.1 Signal transduction histidine-protein kinase BarA [Sphingobacterium multivorum]VXC36488.1 Histidine kinase [Sphingobacterium multivorum]